MDAESKNRIEYTIKGARIQTHTIIATIADVHCTLFNPYRLQITAPESALLVLSHFWVLICPVQCSSLDRFCWLQVGYQMFKAYNIVMKEAKAVLKSMCHLYEVQ